MKYIVGWIAVASLVGALIAMQLSNTRRLHRLQHTGVTQVENSGDEFAVPVELVEPGQPTRVAVEVPEEKPYEHPVPAHFANLLMDEAKDSALAAQQWQGKYEAMSLRFQLKHPELMNTPFTRWMQRLSEEDRPNRGVQTALCAALMPFENTPLEISLDDEVTILHEIEWQSSVYGNYSQTLIIWNVLGEERIRHLLRHDLAAFDQMQRTVDQTQTLYAQQGR